MKKKILALCLVVVLAVTAVTGATLAYFTDSEKATNTMVIGNVEITMDEWKYTEDGWAQYNDKEFVLYPLESEQGINLYNKSVRTYNTTTVPAGGNPDDYAVYMRSIVLIEANDEVTQADNEGACCAPGIHFAFDNREESYVSSYDKTTHYAVDSANGLDKTVTVGDKEYWAFAFVQAEGEKIPVGHALSSLHSVYMDKNVTDDQVDGWGADGVQVIAFTQAIQAKGLTYDEAMVALGDFTVENVEKWVAEADVMA